MPSTASEPFRPTIRAILIDLSGTLHIGSTPTPHALQALRRLRSVEPRIPFRFCSNTSKEGTRDVIARLRGMGFEINSGHSDGRSILKGKGKEVWTSVGAVGQMLADKGLKKPYFLLSESAREECISGLPAVSADTPYDSVVIGLAPSLLTYDNLTTAFRILIGEYTQSRSESSSTSPKRTIPLIAAHTAQYIQSSSGGLSLGPGPFIHALENAAGVRAEVVGKPSRAFFTTVIDDFDFSGVDKEMEQKGRIVIIGDDIQADLGGAAVELGLWRVLVKTGKYRPGDEYRPGVEPPDEIYESFAAFVDSLLRQKSCL